MNVLVIGGTGNVGRHAVDGLLAREAQVSVLTRSEAKAHALPGRVTRFVGDMEQPESLRAAFRGVDRLLLITPVSQSETDQGLAAVEAAEAARVERIVYITVHKIETAAHIPHFASKLPIVAAIVRSGIEHAFLEPNNFFQNDLALRQAIMDFNVYPQPLGNIGCSRVDVRDIADAAVNALLEPGVTGRAYPIVGPDVLTGSTVAATYSRHLDRPIVYGGDDLERWSAQAREFLPGWMVHDFAIMFRYFQEHGLVADAGEIERSRAIVGHVPRTFDAFVAEVVSEWKGAGV